VNTDTELTAEILFVGATRPAMRWGVSYGAILVNLVFTMEIFLVSKNLLTLLLALPIHGSCLLLCTRDARVFELLALWMRTRGLSYAANGHYWQASSYSPLALAHRRAAQSSTTVQVAL
jgi:type IV secretion system protein VirB3